MDREGPLPELTPARAADIRSSLEALIIAHSPESPDAQDVHSLRQGLWGVIKATNFWKTARRPGAALLREAFKPLLHLMGLHEPDAGFAKRDLKRLEVYSDQTETDRTERRRVLY